MIEPSQMEIEIVDEHQKCSHPEPACWYNERRIRIGELSYRSGESPSMLRKWTKEGLIPHCRRHREHTSYPEHKALAAIREIRRKGTRGVANDEPSMN